MIADREKKKLKSFQSSLDKINYTMACDKTLGYVKLKYQSTFDLNLKSNFWQNVLKRTKIGFFFFVWAVEGS